MARPMPRVPPVTIAIFPVSDSIDGFYAGCGGSPSRVVRIATGMAPARPHPPLRQLFEDRISQLSSEVEALFAEARERARRDFAEQLNQSVRRMRQAAGLGGACRDAGRRRGAVSRPARPSSVSKTRSARGERSAVCRRRQPTFSGTCEFRSPQRRRSAGAVETRDPVTAVATAAEVSPDLLGVGGHIAGRARVRFSRCWCATTCGRWSICMGHRAGRRRRTAVPGRRPPCGGASSP